jgi:hypothetical protein
MNTLTPQTSTHRLIHCMVYTVWHTLRQAARVGAILAPYVVVIISEMHMDEMHASSHLPSHPLPQVYAGIRLHTFACHKCIALMIISEGLFLVAAACLCDGGTCVCDGLTLGSSRLLLSPRDVKHGNDLVQCNPMPRHETHARVTEPRRRALTTRMRPHPPTHRHTPICLCLRPRLGMVGQDGVAAAVPAASFGTMLRGLVVSPPPSLPSHTFHLKTHTQAH